MRIAVMAAGGVGGYFGARLAAAGHDVVFIARGAHRDAIRAKGLRVESALGDVTVSPAKVTDDPAQVGHVDIVLFAVKLWDTEAAARQAAPLIGPGTRLVTLQNGVDSVERIATVVDADNVVGGVAYIATVIAAPGVISHTSQFAQMRIGRIDGASDTTLQSFADAAKAAGIDIIVSDDINRDRWQKFAFLVGLSGITAGTREPMGAVMADPDTKAFFRKLMEEVVAVSRAKSVKLPEGLVDERMSFAATAPKTMKASMLHDLERGNRMELDWLAGKVVEFGRQLNVPVPANEAVYSLLKLHRMGRQA